MERSSKPRGSGTSGGGACRSHYRPRSCDGWIFVIAFVALLALTQPPFVHGWANRIEPWLFGLPFLYAYLLVLYVALIVILIRAYRRGV